LQGLIKSALLSRASGAPRVIGFSSSYARERLRGCSTRKRTIRDAAGSTIPAETRHVVEMNLGLLEPLGVTPGRAEFPIEDVDSNVARWALSQTGGAYVLLNPGAAWPNKRWPPDRFAALAVALRNRRGLMSVILWGPGEEVLAKATPRPRTAPRSHRRKRRLPT
jgi:ADP-heptose:LPS heptosyltransferase